MGGPRPDGCGKRRQIRRLLILSDLHLEQIPIQAYQREDAEKTYDSPCLHTDETRQQAIRHSAAIRNAQFGQSTLPLVLGGGHSERLNPYFLFGGAGYKREINALREYLDDNFSGCHLSLADVPRHTLFAELMKGMAGGDFTERTSYHVPLESFNNVDEYIGSLSKNIYKNIRKAYNHLKTDGKKMELKTYTGGNLPGNGYLYKLWRMYFVRKLAWNEKHTGVINMLVARIKAILEVSGGCATQSLRKLEESRLYVLEIDSRPAAFMIVYAHQRHLLMPRLAIDIDFGRYSPGIIMLLEAVKLWLDERFVDFDMCRGDERYKIDMGGVNEPLCRIERGIHQANH